MSDEPARSGRATRSAALGLLSLLFLFALKEMPLSQLVVVAIGAAAVVLGIRGLIDIRRSGGRLKGRVLAGAGILTGLLGTGLAIFVMSVIPRWLMDMSDRQDCTLPQLYKALLLYADDHRSRLPPAAVCGPGGQPLYSWRVLILPYIQEEALYKEFHLDEPWDSPHNIALLSRMPAAYAQPRWKASQVPAGHTVIHVFVGKGAAFEGQQGLKVPGGFRKGFWDTILVVEAGPPVPWTKPEDLAYDPDGPLPDLRGLFRDGFRALLGRGDVRFVWKETSEARIRWAISRDSQEPWPGDL